MTTEPTPWTSRPTPAAEVEMTYEHGQYVVDGNSYLWRWCDPGQCPHSKPRGDGQNWWDGERHYTQSMLTKPVIPLFTAEQVAERERAAAARALREAATRIRYHEEHTFRPDDDMSPRTAVRSVAGWVERWAADIESSTAGSTTTGEEQ